MPWAPLVIRFHSWCFSSVTHHRRRLPVVLTVTVLLGISACDNGDAHGGAPADGRVDGSVDGSIFDDGNQDGPARIDGGPARIDGGPARIDGGAPDISGIVTGAGGTSTGTPGNMDRDTDAGPPVACALDCHQVCQGQNVDRPCGSATCGAWQCDDACTNSNGTATWCCIDRASVSPSTSEQACLMKTGQAAPCRNNSGGPRCGHPAVGLDCPTVAGVPWYTCTGICGGGLTCIERADCCVDECGGDGDLQSGAGILCHGRCVDSYDDPSNCGACGKVCPGTAACVGGQCICANGVLNGVVGPEGGRVEICGSSCVDLDADAANCGSCGAQCPAGAKCSSGQCQCPAGTSVVVGCCTTGLEADPANCGACGNACRGNTHCAGGMCECPEGQVLSNDDTCCPPGQTHCGASGCVDMSKDNANCGACGLACSGGSSCENGVCECPVGKVLTDGLCCLPGELNCANVCENPLRSASNCGKCGASCPVACRSGRCVTVVAASGGLDGVDACAVFSDGSADCWGPPLAGDGTTNPQVPATGQWTPAPVAGLGNATDITLGYKHACAILSGGGVACWGSNASAQLGSGTAAAQSATPVVVPDVSKAITISAGNSETCVVVADGTVRCWGKLVDGSQSAASIAVPGLTNATMVSVGYDHACVVLSNGKMSCWGDDTYGELADGTTTSSSTPVMTKIALPPAIVAVGAGDGFTCLLSSSGAVECGGKNDYGQLGGAFQWHPWTGQDAAVALVVNSVGGAAEVDGGGIYAWGTVPGILTSYDEELSIGTVPGAKSLFWAPPNGAGRQSICALLTDGSVQCQTGVPQSAAPQWQRFSWGD